MRMRREKRWESTLRTAKQGIGVGCAHDHYYAGPDPLEMKGVGTGRGRICGSRGVEADPGKISKGSPLLAHLPTG